MRAKLNRALAGLVMAGCGIALGAQASAAGLSGSYLAAQSAAARNDYQAAARYFAAALARDPGNPGLRERTMSFKLLTGDLRGAATIAQLMRDAGAATQLAELALAADDVASGDYAGAAETLSTDDSRVNALVAALMRGWAEAGAGDREAMEEAFASLDGDAMGELFGNYHLGLARAVIGDLEGAKEALERTRDEGGVTGRPALALGAVLELSGEPEAARAIYEGMAASSRDERVAAAALQRMAQGEPAALPVADASAGTAEALFSIAAALGSDRNAAVALLYARVALALRPELHEARLLVAGLLDAQGQEEAAVEAFQVVPRRSPLFISAELGRADALMALERQDEAVVVLESLSAAYPSELDAQLGLAAALRRTERWTDSAAAYDRALDLIEPIERRHWSVFYERGIAHERAGDWPDAEADFQRALELSPDNPLVLNYLGYSWVEMHMHLDEAQAMIEKAVEQRPDDGYITDSLGWVLYRLD
ncbi:MAG: tetratricopeptide repeat protein [Albimonas sp.]|uniref:tetratricopeptide repeat protein n=1 Tax=Albimonas sp. TaxID=1872425 RepID=UPI004057C75E